MDTHSTPNNKIRKSYIRIVVYVLMLVTGEDESVYYGVIHGIWELDFQGFKILLFCCD
jgi:hypothetical protein